MFNIVLFGPPGAGKGTQSKFLIEEYGLYHICPGDILRREVGNETDLGKEVQRYIDKGQLAPNELVVAMVEKKMKNLPTTRGVLFDGYPRTYLQASALDKQLEELCKSTLSLVIVLNVDEQESQKRIKARSKILHRADDENEDSIVKRMQLYKQTTMPVLDYYKTKKKLVRIKGQGQVDQVTIRIKNAISTHLHFK